MNMIIDNKNKIKIKVEKFKHPELNNREVSVIFVNNNLDLPSFKFLCNEAVQGGRRGQPSAKTSHKGRAYKIAELYEHLHNKGLTWQTAEEEDIREIRNSMLHWNINDNYSSKDYMIVNEYGKKELAYEAIRNDSMNQKLSVWFKFYKYQIKKQQNLKLIPSTKMIEIAIEDAKLQHLKGTKIGHNKVLIERWDLLVPPSPRSLYYNVISEVEYEAFKTQLLKIDPVYAAIADFAVSTGLRKSAVLNDVKPSFFKSIFRDMNKGGQKFNTAFRPMSYENKGGNFEKVDVPLTVIQEINTIYLSTLREDRKNRHALKYGDELNYMWFREDGKKIEPHDLDLAFRKASSEMNRIAGINNIKPHTLRHSFATWAVIRGAKQLGINLLTLNSGEIPNLIKWVQLQLAHISDKTTNIYIVTAILLLTPKRSGPVLHSNMLHKGKILKDLLEADAKLYFGEKFDISKFDALEWAKFKQYDMESNLVMSLQKELQ